MEAVAIVQILVERVRRCRPGQCCWGRRTARRRLQGLLALVVAERIGDLDPARVAAAAIVKSRRAIGRGQRIDQRVGVVGVARCQSQHVGDRGQPPSAIVGERCAAPERVGDLGDLQRETRIAIGERRLPPGRVGQRREQNLIARDVVIESNRVSLRVGDLGQKHVPRIGGSAVGLRIGLHRTVEQLSVIDHRTVRGEHQHRPHPIRRPRKHRS